MADPFGRASVPAATSGNQAGRIPNLPRPASIAIVIPTHNRASTLMRPIGSVLASGDTALELVVIDDASTDRTCELARKVTDERLRYERLETKANGSTARNRGVAVSTAPIVAFLDSDDAFEPGRPERLVRFFDQHPDIDAVVDGFKVVKGSHESLADMPNRVLTGRDLAHLLVTHAIPLTCSSIAVRRIALNAVGGFDEELSRQQDRDLLLRLSASHMVALGTGSDVVKHQSADSLSRISAGYIATLDLLVGRHDIFREAAYEDVLAYLTNRMILKDVVGGRLLSAAAELRALSRSQNLPKSIFRSLRRHSRGRLARRLR